MATVIQIKRSTGSAAPSTGDLVEAELAYSEDRSGSGAAAKLYISSIDSGGSEVIQEVGGKYYTDLIDNAASANTASTLVKRDGSGNFSAGTVTFGSLSDGSVTVTAWVDQDDMSSNSATLIPTQQSVKAYVDSQVTAQDMDVTSDSGTIDIDLDSEALTIAGGTGISTSASGTTVTATLDNTAVTAASYGSASAIPVITIDAQGRITAASTAVTSSVLTIGADSGTNDTVTVGTDTLEFDGTANEIETTVSNNKITIGLPNNVTIGGNLTVSGTTTTVASTTLSVADPLIILASGNNSSDVVDIGLYGLFDTSGSQDLYGGLFRDANDSGKWKLFKDNQAAPTTTVNTGGTGYAVATLVAHLEDSSVAITGGTITGITDLVVADGGTGVGTFTSNGVLYGNGAGAIQATAAGTDTYFMYSNSGTPAWTNVINGGTY
jgi:hypothetical protein